MKRCAASRRSVFFEPSHSQMATGPPGSRAASVKGANGENSASLSRSQMTATEGSGIKSRTNNPRLRPGAPVWISEPVRFAPFRRQTDTPNSFVAIQVPPKFPSTGARSRVPLRTARRGSKAGFRVNFSSRLQSNWYPSLSWIQLTVHMSGTRQEHQEISAMSRVTSSSGGPPSR
jgi:hypothetical protein